MNKYRDYDNYLKEYPDQNGYFGEYGGNYLDNPELINAFNEYSLSLSCAASAETSRDAPHRSTTARICQIFWEGHRFISSAKISTTPAPTSSTTVWARVCWPNIWGKRN